MIRRAVVLRDFGGPEMLEIVEEQLPEPPPEALLVGVEALGVNFGDTLLRRGLYAPGQPRSWRPGFEAAGTVLRTPHNSGPQPGEPVIVHLDHSAYATVLAAPPSRVFPRPPGLDAATGAAIFAQGVTAHYAVHRFGRVEAGDRVLVHAAAGGVGSLAIQLVALAGGAAVGLSSTAAKRATVRELGAVACFAPHELLESPQEVAGPDHLDVVIDSVGGDLFTAGFDALGNHGRYVVIGAAAMAPDAMDARRLLVRSQTVCGFVLGQVAKRDPTAPRQALAELAALVQSGALRTHVEEIAFEDVAAAHRRLETRETTGKLVLRVAG